MAGCKVIGIFGGVGSGKSIAAGYLKNKYKAYIIQADDIAHRLYKKGQNGYKAIIRICGKSILDDNKEIDRKKLAELLFSNPELLIEVNSAIHPMVYKKTATMIDEYKKNHNHGLIVYEAAILPDSSIRFWDESWYVYTPSEERVRRLKNDRGYSESKIANIMNNQPSDEEYRDFCDKVIVNDKDIKKLEEQIDEIVKYSQRQQR